MCPFSKIIKAETYESPTHEFSARFTVLTIPFSPVEQILDPSRNWVVVTTAVTVCTPIAHWLSLVTAENGC